MSFIGANPNARLVPFKPLDTVVSYFIGSNPEGWHPDVPAWGGVRYVELYPGVDLEITAEKGGVAQRLVAQPDAGVDMVRMHVEGAEFVAKVVRHAPQATLQDVDKLRTCGLLDEDVMDVILTIAWSTFAGVVVNAMGFDLSSEYLAGAEQVLGQAIYDTFEVGRPVRPN